MNIVLVTHAEASREAPRSLTDAGIAAASRTADRISEILGEGFRVKKAVCSPAVRCVQTALVILSMLPEATLRRLDTDPRLMAADDPMEPRQLSGALADYPCEGLLVALHADLANALPRREAVIGAKEGWFAERPILCVLDWEKGRPWEENRIMYLEGPDGLSLLVAGNASGSGKKPLLT